MATESHPKSRRADRRSGERNQTIPSPEKVRALAAEIRAEWTPSERKRRAVMARYWLLKQLEPGLTLR